MWELWNSNTLDTSIERKEYPWFQILLSHILDKSEDITEEILQHIASVINKYNVPQIIGFNNSIEKSKLSPGEKQSLFIAINSPIQPIEKLSNNTETLLGKAKAAIEKMF